MKRRQREAIVAALDVQLASKGSWCGETHLQKSMYFLQEMLTVPAGFTYILYKYGPFSQDLRSELASMRADGFLELVPQPQPYGPTLQTTPSASDQLIDRWPKTLKRYESHIDFVAGHLGELGVGDLEKLATALWVLNEKKNASNEERAQRIHELKPHVDVDQALDALTDVQQMEIEAAELIA